ncbi:D-alanyl-D-alanine carboxypeptidase, partial [Geodermatophilus sp. DF01-2]|uniref:D-alanyl-D-alanine carboxypeptidase family protein n=1 Tax=Geodermatophilus sp. DF01-2 TaxID=2559610 RepID=UPI001FD84BAB
MPRRPAVHVAGALLAAGLLLGGAGPALAEEVRPTADPSAPTPTAPLPGGPPQGSGPGDVPVGGSGLDTRGTVGVEGAPPLPDGIAAAGRLVADAGSGAVLATRDPHGRYYPASTLKMLTLLTLLPLLDPAAVVEGTVEDEAVAGSRVGLVAGGRYPVALLFQALGMQSGNDAANALARAAGGTDLTVRAMNETAAAIGALTPSRGRRRGWTWPASPPPPTTSRWSSAGWSRTRARWRSCRRRPHRCPPVEGRSPGFQIQNQNPLAGTPGNLGGKTGFTDAARHTFVTAAERDGRRLVVSVMGTENVPLRAADQAARLLDRGFTVPAGRGDHPGPAGRGDHPDHPGRLVDSAADVPPPSPPAPLPAVAPGV